MDIVDFAIPMYHRIYSVNYLAVRIQFHHWIVIVIHDAGPCRPFPANMISILNSFRHPIRPFRCNTSHSVHLLIATSYQLQWIDYCPCEWCRPPTSMFAHTKTAKGKWKTKKLDTIKLCSSRPRGARNERRQGKSPFDSTEEANVRTTHSQCKFHFQVHKLGKFTWNIQMKWTSKKTI